MKIHLIGPHGSRDVQVPLWYRFSMWIESEQVQLCIALITYYMVCALVGAFQGMQSAYEIKRALWIAFGGSG